MPPRPNSRRFRRAGLAGFVASGCALLGTGVQGLAGMDDRLETASERQRKAAQVERKWRDCQRHRDAVSERERL